MVSLCVCPVQSKDGTWLPAASDDKFRDLFVAFRIVKRPLPSRPDSPPPLVAHAAGSGSDPAARSDTLAGAPPPPPDQAEEVAGEGMAAERRGSEAEDGGAAGKEEGGDAGESGGSGGAGGAGEARAGGGLGALDVQGAPRRVEGLDALDGLYGDEPLDGARCVRRGVGVLLCARVRGAERCGRGTLIPSHGGSDAGSVAAQRGSADVAQSC